MKISRLISYAICSTARLRCAGAGEASATACGGALVVGDAVIVVFVGVVVGGGALVVGDAVIVMLVGVVVDCAAAATVAEGAVDACTTSDC